MQKSRKRTLQLLLLWGLAGTTKGPRSHSPTSGSERVTKGSLSTKEPKVEKEKASLAKATPGISTAAAWSHTRRMVVNYALHSTLRGVLESVAGYMHAESVDVTQNTRHVNTTNIPAPSLRQQVVKTRADLVMSDKHSVGLRRRAKALLNSV